MTRSITAGSNGYVHEAIIYGSDDEFVGVVVPRLDAAADARIPVLAALDEHEAGLVRSAVRDTSALTFLPPLTPSERPPNVIKGLLALVPELIAGGARQVQVVQTVPHPGLGAPWYGWCRYEAAVNELLDELPLWGMCLYDRRITPAQVLHDVEQTHPRITTPDGTRWRNDHYLSPSVFLRSRPQAPADPLEVEPPARELLDPLPAAGRRAVRELAPGHDLSEDDIDRLVLATSEAITNAIVHGRRPVIMRAWAGPRRMVVTVMDHGPGPDDPYVGLVPQSSPAHGRGGLGLWIVDQLVAALYSRSSDGFTVRLVVGEAQS
jgi:anti-sigma regulatory factor (Ser/Thr protein kinase)